jgi:hypothetical protein
MHKVRVDVAFKDMEEYLSMKGQLEKANLKLDWFVNYSVNLVWNQMLEDYSKQLAAEANLKYEANSPAIDSDSAGVSVGESPAPSESEIG